MPLPAIIANLFGGKAKEIATTVMGGLDNLFTSKEEKLKAQLEIERAVSDHVEKMAAIAQSQLEAELKDMANARDREIQIATSDKAPVLNKIITPVLGLIIVCSTLIIWSLILFRNYEPKTNEAMIIGSLTTLTAGVISYYFGSSTGSKQKGEQLDKMINKG